jgi:hypothetical protein
LVNANNIAGTRVLRLCEGATKKHKSAGEAVGYALEHVAEKVASSVLNDAF